jgi:hypothetical protein
LNSEFSFLGGLFGVPPSEWPHLRPAEGGTPNEQGKAYISKPFHYFGAIPELVNWGMLDSQNSD